MMTKAFVLFLLLSLVSPVFGQEKKHSGMPPAKVVLATVERGMLAPETEFIGTVYFPEVSDVASEVRGIVEKVSFEEGLEVTKGDILVRLGDDIMKKTLEATKASHEEIITELEMARNDLGRIKNLYKDSFISDQSLDESLYRVRGLEKKSFSLKAEVERLQVELSKKNIKAPFSGIILKREVDRGEWISTGDTVATLALHNEVDVIADIPESSLKYIEIDKEVHVKAGNSDALGNIIAIIPKGDIKMRTFPVKIRLDNTLFLKEGMEAVVRLPSGPALTSLLVPRDALITVRGQNAVFTIIDSHAKTIHVDISGYSGMSAGVKGNGLKVGMPVVIKGNERLREGQSVVHD